MPVTIASLSLSDLRIAQDKSSELAKSLQSSEQERLAQISHSQRRIEFIFGHALLHACLALHLPKWREQTKICYKNNIPCVSSELHPNLDFNISHSADFFVCAVSSVSTVGIDVESSEFERDLLKIAWRHFHPKELKTLATLSASEQAIRIRKLWTLKESTIKRLKSTIGHEGLKQQFVSESDAELDKKLSSGHFSFHDADCSVSLAPSLNLPRKMTVHEFDASLNSVDTRAYPVERFQLVEA